MSAMPAPGPADRPEWFYLRNRQKAGPFTLAQLQRLLEAGELRPDDLVLRPGAEVWAAVSAVPDLTPPVPITTTPGLAPAPVPAPEDWPGPEPSVRRDGFWHWYRTHPGLVALLVVGLLLLLALPVLILVFQSKRQMQAAQAMAQAQAMAAQAQALRAEQAARAELEERHAKDVLLDRRDREELAEFRREAYADNISRAYQTWKNKNLAAANQHLDRTCKDLRGWEYRYLRRLVGAGLGGAECRTLPEHHSPVHAVAFSPDGRVLASADGSVDRPGVVRLWELDGKGEPRILEGHTGLIGCLSFSPDGKQLVTGSSDRSIKVWNVENGKVRLSLAGHEGPVTGVDFSPDGKDLVSVGGGTIKVWRSDTGEAATKLDQATGPYYSVIYLPDRWQLAATSLDGTVKVWEREKGTVRVLGQRQDKLLSAAHLCSYPNGKVPCCGWALAVTGLDIKLWGSFDGPEPSVGGTERGPFRAIAFSPDGWRVATGSEDRTIRLWDAAHENELLCLTGHGDAVTSLAFSPDGRLLVSGSVDGTVKVWEAAPAEK